MVHLRPWIDQIAEGLLHQWNLSNPDAAVSYLPKQIIKWVLRFVPKLSKRCVFLFVDVSMFEYVSFLSSSSIRHRDVQTSSGEHDRIISVNGVSEPPTAVALQLTYLVWFNEGIQGESLPTGLFIEKEHRFSVEHVLKDIKCR